MVTMLSPSELEHVLVLVLVRFSFSFTSFVSELEKSVSSDVSDSSLSSSLTFIFRLWLSWLLLLLSKSVGEEDESQMAWV